jgi:O-antigen ligase
MWFLFVFLIVAFLSILLSELNFTEEQAIKYLQTVYWFFLAVIVYNLYPFIEKERLSKYIFFSVLLLLVLYIVGLKVGSQNGVAFVVIVFAPLGFFFLKKLWIKAGFTVILVFLMLLNGSRTGALISSIQSILIILLSLPRLNRYFKTLLIAGLTIFAVFINETILEKIGGFVMPFNERLGMLMVDTQFVLHNDISWLQRQAQIQKGKQIFEKHPIIGIGYLNFVRFYIDIDESQIETDRKLRNIDYRSSHNSYVSIISETGIIGFTVMILFYLINIVNFWKSTRIIGNTFEASVFISFFGMLIYFYMISGHLGTSTWIIYGLATAASLKVSKRAAMLKKRRI